MKFLKNDVVLLLAFILLFCFGLGFLRNDQDIFFCVDSLGPRDISEDNQELPAKTEKIVSAHISGCGKKQRHKQEKLTDFSDEQLLSYMKPLFITKSASAIISFLKHIPSASVFKIVKAIVKDNKNNLPNRVKLRIIFAGAQRQKNRKEKCDFFDLISHNARLQKGVKPLLVKAVEAGYSHLVHDILDWAKYADISDISQEALLYAARHDDEDPEALRELFEAGVSINSSVASDLLCEVVRHCSEGYSIPFLVDVLGADLHKAKIVAHSLGKTEMIKPIALNA